MMNQRIGLYLCMFCLTAFFSPATAAGKRKLSSAKDINGAWQVSEIKGVPVAESEKPPFLSFDCMKKKVNGWAGCNHIQGSFKFNPVRYQLHFSPIASTRMACPFMETENMLLQSLAEVSGYLSDTDKDGHKRLVLYNDEGSEILEMTRMMPLDGRWNVVKVNDFAIENDGGEIFLIFDSYRKILSGQLGCNTYHASLICDLKKTSVIRIENGAVSLRMCAEPDAEMETRLLQALEKVVSYKKFSDGKAILCDGGGNVLIELAR